MYQHQLKSFSKMNLVKENANICNIDTNHYYGKIEQQLKHEINVLSMRCSIKLKYLYQSLFLGCDGKWFRICFQRDSDLLPTPIHHCQVYTLHHSFIPSYIWLVLLSLSSHSCLSHEVAVLTPTYQTVKHDPQNNNCFSCEVNVSGRKEGKNKKKRRKSVFPSIWRKRWKMEGKKGVEKVFSHF